MKINILTVTTGREFYLRNLLTSFDKLSNWQKHEVRYHIVYQGIPSDEFLNFLRKFKFNILLSTTEYVHSIGAIMTKFKNDVKSDYFWKLDDDAKLCSDNMLDHIEALCSIYPDAIFSPYPVGLINNPGGVPSKQHHVIYSGKNDTFYTLRKVAHIGGFARIMPGYLLDRIHFSDSHSEDTECASVFNALNLPMYYLENSLIVEHQESTLGQHERYKNYFNNRF